MYTIGLPGAEVLLAELGDDLRARRRHVAEDPRGRSPPRTARRSRAGTRPGTAGTARSSRIPIISQCPVVVSFPAERSVARPCARAAARPRARRPRSRQVPEAERLEVRRAEPADRARGVAERVGAVVAVRGGVGRVAHAPRIADDEQHARHRRVVTGSPLLLAVIQRSAQAALSRRVDRFPRAGAVASVDARRRFTSAHVGERCESDS